MNSFAKQPGQPTTTLAFLEKDELVVKPAAKTSIGSSFGEALRGLPEPVAQAFQLIFAHLLSKAVHEFAEGSHFAADGTRHGSITVTFVGTGELLAAARAAH